MTLPALTVVAHPERGMIGTRRAIHPRSKIVLGRTSQSFLPGLFDDPKVSREHARIEYDGERVVLCDLDSRNGTQVNGQAVAERAIDGGDLVTIGKVTLLLTHGPDDFAEPDHPQLLGVSHELARLLEQIDRLADTDETVLLVGETGTGKELVARALHEESARRGRFVPLNCGGLPEGVLHSELFGHVRGAFSGAESGRGGLLERAEGGTLFLDEVCSAPPSLQTSLLRLLDDGTYRVVGTSELLRAKLRVVAAMQPAEERRSEAGRLRRDLYFRLARRIIRVPPLRERPEDIAFLAHHFAAAVGEANKPLSAGLLTALLHYSWPGNVRELRSVVERIALEQPDGFELELPSWLPAAFELGDGQSVPEPRGHRGTKKRRRRPSQERLVAELREHEGSVAALATSWRVDRKTIYRWIEALEVDLDRLRERSAP